MTVFYFITKSEQGGAQTHVAQMTEYLLERGHTVVVMSAPGGWLEEEVRRFGGAFIVNTSLNNTINPIKLWSAGKQFLQAVRDARPDLVACHSTIAGLIGRYALRNRIPTVFTAHGWGFTKGSSFLRRIFLIPLERIAGRYAARIICVSQIDTELARRFGIVAARKVVKINNGAALMRAKNYNSGKKTIDIVFVGRLAKPKNPFLLVEAIKKLSPHLQRKIHVSIIGDGPQKHGLQVQIRTLGLEPRIILMGALARNRVLSFLQEQADIFVLTSRFEGFPYSILEAMATGVPVVATDVGGIREAVGEGAGIIIPRDNADALCRALVTLILNPALREQQGRAGYRRIERFFSVDIMCEKTLELYRSVFSE